MCSTSRSTNNDPLRACAFVKSEKKGNTVFTHGTTNVGTFNEFFVTYYQFVRGDKQIDESAGLKAKLAKQATKIAKQATEIAKQATEIAELNARLDAQATEIAKLKAKQAAERATKRTDEQAAEQAIKPWSSSGSSTLPPQIHPWSFPGYSMSDGTHR
jgi:hypothetical protein